MLTYTDGTEETCGGNDLLYWPPGHSVRVTQDAEVVLFSPQQEHTEVMDHMRSRWRRHLIHRDFTASGTRGSLAR